MQIIQHLGRVLISATVLGACGPSTTSPAHSSATASERGASERSASETTHPTAVLTASEATHPNDRPASEVFAAPTVVGPASASKSPAGTVLTVRGLVLADPSLCKKDPKDKSWRVFFAQATDVGAHVCFELLGTTLGAKDGGLEFDAKGSVVLTRDGAPGLQVESVARTAGE